MKSKTLAKAAGILTLAAASLLYSANNKTDARGEASAPSGLETKIEKVEQKVEQKTENKQEQQKK